MKPWLAHLLTRLYPLSWRQRYGAEFEVFLQTSRGNLRPLANVLWSAVSEQISPTLGLSAKQFPGSFGMITKLPSAFLPMIMSLAALALVFVHAAIFGIVHEVDEGTPAHLWQLLIAGQMAVLVFFVIKWLPRAPRQTLQVIVLQAAATLANFAAVFFLT